MPVLNSQVVADKYPDQTGSAKGAILANVYNGRGGWFSVTGATAFVRLQYGKQGEDHWVEEIFLGAGAFVVLPANCIGLQFRNGVAGVNATVTAQIAQGDEPALAISTIGQTNTVLVSSLNFQHNALAAGTEPTLNLIDAAGVITWTVTDNVAQTRVDVTPAFTSPALFPGAVGIGGNGGDTQISRLAAGVVGATTAFSTGPLGSGAGAASGIYMGALLVLDGAASNTALLATSVTTTDSQYRHVVDASGVHTWGPGGASARDATFQRLAGGVLGDTATALSTGPTAVASSAVNGVIVQAGSSTGGGIFSTGANSAFTLLWSSITTEANPRFQMFASGTMTWGPGGATATDTTVSRVAAGVLQIGVTGQGGRWAAQQPAATNLAFSSAVDGDTVARFQVQANGTIKWGPGNAVADTGLQRNSAGYLKLTVQASVFGSLNSNGAAIGGDGTNSSWSLNDQGAASHAYFVSCAPSGFNSLATTVPGDATSFRFQLDTNGVHSWSPGNTAFDLVLKRVVNAPSGTGTFLELTTGAGLGYGTGTGGTVTIANLGSGTLNKPTGTVTASASVAAGGNFAATVTNSVVGADDTIIICVQNGGGTGATGSIVCVTTVAAGSFTFVYHNGSAGAITPVFTFAVIKGAVA